MRERPSFFDFKSKEDYLKGYYLLVERKSDDKVNDEGKKSRVYIIEFVNGDTYYEDTIKLDICSSST